MLVRPTVAAAAVALALAGCSTSEGIGPRTVVGASTGALVGGMVGGAAGRGPGGVLAGALVGGLIGGTIGNALDEEDRRRAYAAEIEALERGQSGAPTAWRNPDNGRYGTVVPGPAYQRAGLDCREYTHTIYIDGRPRTARGTACRQPDGSWQPVS